MSSCTQAILLVALLAVAFTDAHATPTNKLRKLAQAGGRLYWQAGVCSALPQGKACALNKGFTGACCSLGVCDSLAGGVGLAMTFVCNPGYLPSCCPTAKGVKTPPRPVG